MLRIKAIVDIRIFYNNNNHLIRAQSGLKLNCVYLLESYMYFYAKHIDQNKLLCQSLITVYHWASIAPLTLVRLQMLHFPYTLNLMFTERKNLNIRFWRRNRCLFTVSFIDAVVYKCYSVNFMMFTLHARVFFFCIYLLLVYVNFQNIKNVLLQRSLW